MANMTPNTPPPDDAAPQSAPSRARSDFPELVYWLALAALFALAICLRHVLAANTDVSWLLTAGERVLEGKRLYVDVIETNPPMAVLAYLPGIVIARALHLRAEVVTDVLVFLGIAISLLVSARILKRSSALDTMRGWPLALIAFVTLAILPTQTFGQREHLALIALLPMLAMLALRGKGETPPRWAIVVAGFGAGLTLAFKPHFAIAIFCAVAALAIHARDWKIFIAPENLIAAAVAGLYAMGVAIFYPDYFSVIVPLMRDVYVPVGISLTALLGKDALAIWGILTLAAILLKRRTAIGAPFTMLLAASFGFALVFLIQRKGFAYHSYPMIALAILALGTALASHRYDTRFNRGIGILMIVLFALEFAVAMIWFDNAFDAKPLEARVAKLGAHPKILALTAEPGIGHPLVRALGGTWVSRQQGLWIAAYADRIRKDAGGALDPARAALLDTYEARERAMLIADIKANPPTVVLVDDLTGGWSAWLRAHPDVSAVLADYRRVDTLNNVGILTRD